MTQLLDSVQATTGTISGQAIIPNWTRQFYSNGGTLMFTTSFSSYATVSSLATFDFLIDGNVVANTRFFFNNTSIHLTIPSYFNIENISVGFHTGAIRIPSGVTVDSQDYCNMSLIEVLGANSVGLTGPTGTRGFQGLVGTTGNQGFQGFQGIIGVTGSIGSQGVQGFQGPTGNDGIGVLASFMRGSRTSSQSCTVNPTTIIFNQVDASYSTDISLDTSTGIITLGSNRIYRLIAQIPNFAGSRPAFTWYNRTTSSSIGSIITGYGSNDAASFGSMGGISEAIINTSSGSVQVDYRMIQGATTTVGGNNDFPTSGSYAWFDIQVVAGNAPALIGNQGFQGLVGTTGSQGFQGLGGSSNWISSTGGLIYYNSGSVGINTSNPTGSLSVVGIVSITGSLNITGNITHSTGSALINSTLSAYKESIIFSNTTSSSYIVNAATGNNFQITLTTGTTLSFINFAPTGTVHTINLYLTQDASGNRIITWPSSISWGNPGVPILSNVGGSTDILSFTTFTGGSKILGFLVGRGY